MQTLANSRPLLILGVVASALLIFIAAGSRSRNDLSVSMVAPRMSRVVNPAFHGPAMRISASRARSLVANSAAVDAPVRREALTTAKGGRKRAHAKCAVFPGSGKIVINDKEANEYFKNNLVAYMELYQLLYLIGLHGDHDVHFRVEGGGVTGQKDAIKLAAARLLLKDDFPLSSALPKDQLKALLKENGWLSRDARRKERKKYGLKKARKAPQFSKR